MILISPLDNRVSPFGQSIRFWSVH